MIFLANNRSFVVCDDDCGFLISIHEEKKIIDISLLNYGLYGLKYRVNIDYNEIVQLNL